MPPLSGLFQKEVYFQMLLLIPWRFSTNLRVHGFRPAINAEKLLAKKFQTIEESTRANYLEKSSVFSIKPYPSVFFNYFTETRKKSLSYQFNYVFFVCRFESTCIINFRHLNLIIKWLFSVVKFLYVTHQPSYSMMICRKKSIFLFEFYFLTVWVHAGVFAEFLTLFRYLWK